VFRESCGDPRKGTLFAIVEGWLTAAEKARLHPEEKDAD